MLRQASSQNFLSLRPRSVSWQVRQVLELIKKKTPAKQGFPQFAEAFYSFVFCKKCKLGSDAGDQIGHAAGVSGFVVVPTYNFGSVANNHGQVRVENARVLVSNDVNAHDGVGAIFHDALQRAFSRSLHGSIDLSGSSRLFQGYGEISYGSVGNGNTHGVSVQLAGQVRQYQPYRLGSTSAGGNDAVSSSAGTAQILVGRVLQILVRGIGVNRGHETVLNSKVFVQHLHHGGQAVGGTASVRQHSLGSVQDVVVHTQYDGFAIASSGGRNDHLLGTSGDVHGCFGGVCEETSRLQYHIYTQFGPGQCLGIALGQGLDFLAVDDQMILVAFYGSRELTVYGIVLEQVGQGGVRSQVVDGNNLDTGFVDQEFEGVAADSAESIDGYFHTTMCLKLSGGKGRHSLSVLSACHTAKR